MGLNSLIIVVPIAQPVLRSQDPGEISMRWGRWRLFGDWQPVRDQTAVKWWELCKAEALPPVSLWWKECPCWYYPEYHVTGSITPSATTWSKSTLKVCLRMDSDYPLSTRISLSQQNHSSKSHEDQWPSTHWKLPIKFNVMVWLSACRWWWHHKVFYYCSLITAYFS